MSAEFNVEDNRSRGGEGDKNCCAAEFQCANFGFDHKEPDLFVRSEWGFSIFYVIYRFFVAGYCFVLLIYSGIVYKYGPKYFIFLTYWSFILLNVNTLLLFITSVIGYYKFKRAQVYLEMPWYLKMVWVFYNVSTQAAFVITVLYWVFEYNTSKTLNIVNVTTHAVNSVFAFIDMLVTAIPIRILHAPGPMIYGATYLIFAPIYWAAGGLNEHGGTYIYPLLDYGNKLGLAIGSSLGTVFVAVPLVQLLLFGLYKLRLTFHCGRINKKVTQRPTSIETRILQAQTS
ncbi:protein rolling stone [Lingula anatina]|uniref:Protein rolling stone n=1 Tax=Lingula anatina TaxID=7574 RepID=A0A1S3H9V7_LINAN|nr:protein rolling stone [Lingula anatina]|eukprot:XP_013382251.1 protein rolling stone [Lingula anatina]